MGIREAIKCYNVFERNLYILFTNLLHLLAARLGSTCWKCVWCFFSCRFVSLSLLHLLQKKALKYLHKFESILKLENSFSRSGSSRSTIRWVINFFFFFSNHIQIIFGMGFHIPLFVPFLLCCCDLWELINEWSGLAV